MKIRVESIPIGYTAVDDDTYAGHGSLIGIGKTEEEAVADLLEQMEDQHPSSSIRQGGK